MSKDNVIGICFFVFILMMLVYHIVIRWKCLHGKHDYHTVSSLNGLGGIKKKCKVCGNEL